MRLVIFSGGFMKRTPNAKSKASALFSAGVMLSAGSQAMAQGAAKAAPPKPAAPAAVAAKPAPASANSSTDFTIKYGATFWKWKGELSAVGMLDGRPVFKTNKGEYFTVEPSTGDLKFHTAESLGFLKYETNDKLVAVKTISGKNFMKFDTIKGESKLSVLGVDAQGHVVQQNSRGEKFYLGPNGDMVFVK
jgi:hypothetical protein